MNEDITRYTEMLHALLSSPCHSFSNNIRAALPTLGGVYRILETGSDSHATVYLGHSSNLQRRIYHDHLMGPRLGSTLKRKLILSGRCVDENAVKQLLYTKCSVQFLILEGAVERKLFEHFAIAILKPDFND